MAMATVARGSRSQIQAETLWLLRRSCTPSNDADGVYGSMAMTTVARGSRSEDVDSDTVDASTSVEEWMQSVLIDRSRRAHIGEYVEVCLSRSVDAVDAD